MTERAAEVPQQPTPSEVLRRPHTYGVVIPYSSNLKEHGDTSPEEFEEREKKLRLLARYDKRGFIPRLLRMVCGPVVTDIKKVSGSDRLGFDNTSGKEKLRQLEENPQD